MVNTNERIKEALALRGMTAADLSRKTGIGKGLISRYLHGEVVPKQSKIAVIARALEVSPAWLLGYDVNMKGELLQPQIELYKLSADNQARLLAYYQALIDSQGE